MTDLSFLTLIEDYTSFRGLHDTNKLLTIYRRKLTDDHTDDITHIRLMHGLSVCRLLIDLQINSSAKEADTAFAAALCRGLTTMDHSDRQEVLELHTDPAILEITHMIGRSDFADREEEKLFYEKIQQNRCALLVLLADRASFLTKLHELPMEESRKQIRNTRRHFFSMCVYATEHYPDIAPMINILKGKIKNLCEVYDILTEHYQTREQELSVEILRIQEDNAKLRNRITILTSLKG